MEAVSPMETNPVDVVETKETKVVKGKMTTVMIRDLCESTCNPHSFSKSHIPNSRGTFVFGPNEKSLRGKI